MPIRWNPFEEMFRSVNEDMVRLRALAETQETADRPAYDILWQRIFDTVSRMLESTGDYTPDISAPSSREEWKAMKEEARSIRSWLLQNKGRLWPK